VGVFVLVSYFPRLFLDSVEEPKQEKLLVIPRRCISPLERASKDVQEQIWNEILAFALCVDPRIIRPPEFMETRVPEWRVGFLFICKMFHVSYDSRFSRRMATDVHGCSLIKRLAMPHFYGQPVIFTREGLHQFSERLVIDTSLALHLRCLHLMQNSWFLYGARTDDIKADNKALMDIVSRAPQLTRFHGSRNCVFSLSWEAFRCMADTAGTSLLEFKDIPIYSGNEVCTAGSFRSFTALRSLVWDCCAKFNANEGKDLRECFPRLISLRIAKCDSSFLKLISHIE
jgi:hypothetical protein